MTRKPDKKTAKIDSKDVDLKQLRKRGLAAEKFAGEELTQNSESEFGYLVTSRLRRLIDTSFVDGIVPKNNTEDEPALTPDWENKAQQVLVGLSGGPDSTALLNALARNERDFGLKALACHVNHMTRGEESNEDERFCENLCRNLQVELCIRRASATDLKDSNPSEAMLRDIRLNFLLDVAEQYGVHFVCLAHTLDDQVETVLFRLFRGSSMTGILGMQPVRNLTADVALVRPMLSLTRDECLNYLRSLNIEFRDDSSNKDYRYNRNYLRSAVIPQINRRFPGFAKRLQNFCALAKAEEDYLNEIASQRLADLKKDDDRLCLAQFVALPLAIRRRVLALSMREHDIEVSFERVEKITQLVDLAYRGPYEKEQSYSDIESKQRGRSEGNESCRSGSSGFRSERSVDMRGVGKGDRSRRSAYERFASSLNEKWDIRVQNGEIIWVDKSLKPVCLSNDLGVKVPGITVVGQLGLALRIDEWENTLPEFPLPTSLTVLVDLTNTRFPLLVRNRAPGDRIQPFGMKQKVKLKKYLHTHKADKRDSASGPTREQGSEILSYREGTVSKFSGANGMHTHAEGRGDEKPCRGTSNTVEGTGLPITGLSISRIGLERLMGGSIVVADQDEVIWVPGVGLSEKVRVVGRPTHRIQWIEISSDELNWA